MDDLEIDFVEDAGLPQQPPPLERGRYIGWGKPTVDPVRVLIHQRVFEKTQRHAQRTPAVEVGGLLVGRAYQHEGAIYTEVMDYLYVPTAAGIQSSLVHFNFSPDLWTTLNDLHDTNYPELKMVGWFHSHPGHGIFLSGMDLDVHRKAAYLPWQIAMVFDPVHNDGGIFTWQGDAVKQVTGFYEIFAPERSATILTWASVKPTTRATPASAAVAIQPSARPAATAQPSAGDPSAAIRVGQAAPVPPSSGAAPPARIAMPPEIGQALAPPRRRRSLGTTLFRLFGLLLAVALFAISGYILYRIYDNNQRAQQSAFDATRLFYSDQVEALQTSVARGDADSNARITDLQRQLDQSEAERLALSTDSVQLSSSATAQAATLDALLHPPTPTLASTETPTPTATPIETPTPTPGP